ncbi:MAG: hypothetical protein ABIJ00_16060 [Candidatus Eisenbacteria bacterium]
MCLDPALAGMAWAAIVAMAVVGALLTVIPFWRILTKAGLPGPLSLLMLVPVANIILPFYVAFTEWPALRNGSGRSHP